MSRESKNISLAEEVEGRRALGINIFHFRKVKIDKLVKQ